MDDDDNNDDAGDGMSCASTQPEIPDSEESSRPSSAMSSISHHGHGKRHKNNPLPAPMPAPRGANFWSMVDKWFAAHMQPDQLGISWSSPGWVRYV